jgi:hypothetical protein
VKPLPLMLAFGAALLFVQPGLAKRASEPEWDCSIDEAAGADRWDADEWGVGWHRFTDTNAYLSARVHRREYSGTPPVPRDKPLTAMVPDQLVVTPQVAYATQPLWAHLSANNRALAPQLVYVDKKRTPRFYSHAAFAMAEVKSLLTEGGLLTITFYFADGTILNRTTISAEELNTAVERLPDVDGRFRQRAAEPMGVCYDRRDDIIIVN